MPLSGKKSIKQSGVSSDSAKPDKGKAYEVLRQYDIENPETEKSSWDYKTIFSITATINLINLVILSSGGLGAMGAILSGLSYVSIFCSILLMPSFVTENLYPYLTGQRKTLF